MLAAGRGGRHAYRGNSWHCVHHKMPPNGAFVAGLTEPSSLGPPQCIMSFRLTLEKPLALVAA